MRLMHNPNLPTWELAMVLQVLRAPVRPTVKNSKRALSRAIANRAHARLG